MAAEVETREAATEAGRALVREDKLPPDVSHSLGRAIVRKYAGPVATDTLDIAGRASVEVTSENELYPIDHVFDGRSGPGGSCWVAGTPGPQTILLRFHAPTNIENLTIESEERLTCTQEIVVAGWSDDRQSPFGAPPRMLSYTPYGRSFHRETWNIVERGVTYVSFSVVPSPVVRFATLTAILFR
jgi:hypothetical protein